MRYAIDISRQGFLNLLKGQTVYLPLKEHGIITLELELKLKPECFEGMEFITEKIQ